MKKTFLALTLAATLSLGACASQNGAWPTIGGQGGKESLGQLAGAIGGGIIGSNVGGGKGQLIATGVGALAGAWLGGELGRSLDKADQQFMSNAVNQAQSAPIGEPIQWSNPESGNSGVVTPVRDGFAGNNYCREYEQTIIVDGLSLIHISEPTRPY